MEVNESQKIIINKIKEILDYWETTNNLNSESQYKLIKRIFNNEDFTEYVSSEISENLINILNILKMIK